MLALLADSLRRGYSGVREEVVELLLGMLERGVIPVVPSKGSVGSSGDLAPLAHIALVLCRRGRGRGPMEPASAAPRRCARSGWTPSPSSPRKGSR
jgi:histidine ammonia-lyase